MAVQGVLGLEPLRGWRDYGVSTVAEGLAYYSLGDYAVTVEGSVGPRQAMVDVWLDGGSIYISLGRGERYVELDARVVLGVRDGDVVDVEILLGREGVEKLRRLLQP